MTTNLFAHQVAVERHRRAANYLFADAHVDGTAWARIRNFSPQPGTRFLRPDGGKSNP